MRKIDEFWLCEDCSLAAVNNDYTGLDYYDEKEATERQREVQEGLEKLGPNLVCDSNRDAVPCDNHPRDAWVEAVVAGDTDKSWEIWAEDQDDDPGYDEFSRNPCDCCGTKLAGSRTRFATLGEE